MKKLKSFFSKYVGKDKDAEVRFSNLLFIGTGTASFFYVIIGLMIFVPKRAVLICLVLMLYILCMFCISSRNNKEVLLARVSLIIMNFLFFPALFFTTGGINGGAVSFFVLGVVFSYILFTGKTCSIVTTLEVAYYSFVIYASYRWDVLTYVPDSLTYTYMMSAINIVTASLSIGILAKVLVMQYSKEKRNIEYTVEELEALSTMDPLTGVYNRRYMLDFLEQNMKRANDYGADLSVVLFDIDYFKALNDDYGHLVGDEVLVNLSNVFKSQIRSNDIISRYGGEEFVAVFPNMTSQRAYERAEQIRHHVENTVLSYEINRPVTISGGVAKYIKGMTIEEFIDVADKNLYMAKELGRNRICINSENDLEDQQKIK